MKAYIFKHRDQLRSGTKKESSLWTSLSLSMLKFTAAFYLMMMYSHAYLKEREPQPRRIKAARMTDHRSDYNK